MPQKKLLVDGLELHYNGIFDVEELFKAIDKYSKERGYSNSEKRRQEKVSEEGKELSMELRPMKVKDESITLFIKVRLSITNLKKVEVMINKKKKKMDQGNIAMLFDGWVLNDFKGRWGTKPYFYVLRTIVDKYIYNFHSRKYYGEAIGDTHYLHKQIKAHLNLHKY